MEKAKQVYLSLQCLLIMLTVPGAAIACADCFAATAPSSLRAFYLSTAILTVMPFILIGLIFAIEYSARRRAQQAFEVKSKRKETKETP